MEKHAAGYILKKNGASHTEIARILGVSLNTVTAWSKKFNWEDKLIEEQLFQESSLEKVRSLISHNLAVLDAIKDRMLEKHDIKTAPVEDLKKMLTDRGDVDALNKLYVNIRGKEISWDQVVKTIREFTEYLEYEDHDLAQKLADFANDFLDQKRRSA